jgi:uncharacterized protein involved in outer membrane biogenesis
MKKLLWIFGGLICAFLVAVISIPLFVDVDQYRPRIVAEANKRINGQLELGKLSLSLWGTIKIHADSIKLTVNGFPEPMVTTQQFHIEVPIFAALTGHPQAIAVLDSPKINVVKEANGKMNAMELMKVPGAGAQAEPAPLPAPVADEVKEVNAAVKKKPGATDPKAPPPAPAAPSAQDTANFVASRGGGANVVKPAQPVAPAGAPQVPAIVANASLGIRINNGDLNYTDRVTKSTYQVIGLDVNGKNLGLGSEMTITVKAPVKGASPTMTFEGPVTADVALKPVLADGKVKAVSGKIDLDATKLAVEMKGGTFHKTDSMALTAHAQFDGSEAETLLRAIDLQFASYKIHGKGRVVLEPMSVKLDVGSDTLHLNEVQSFVPMVAAYDLKGAANFSATVDWTPAALHADGSLKVDGGSFFLKDVLKAPMGFTVNTGFSENSLTVNRAAISAPDSDIELTGNVKNFLAPQFSFNITGKSFNVDKVLVLPAPGAAPAKSASVFAFEGTAFAEPARGDVNPMLELTKNPMVMAANGMITANIGKITTYNAVMEQVNARVTLSPGLQLKIVDAGLHAFSGTVKTSGEFDLKSPGLGYHSQGSVAGVSAKDALTSQAPKYKNTLEGILDANWNVSGTAFPALTRVHNIKGTAHLSARDGAVKSVDFQESINGAMGKIPFLKGQQVKIDNGFKSFTADVKLDSGVVKVEPIDIEPRGQGLVMKGKSTIQENLDQETFIDVYDPQNILPKELHNGNKPAIPLHVTGQISSPKTDYGYTLQRVASTAGLNVAKDQALKALGVQTTPGMSDQDKLKKAADELKKKFHF